MSGLPRPYDLLWPIHHPLNKEQPAKIDEMPSESPALGGMPGTLIRRMCMSVCLNLVLVWEDSYASYFK